MRAPNRNTLHILALASISWLTACQSYDPALDGPTLAALDAQQTPLIPADSLAVPSTPSDVRKLYTEALESSDDPLIQLHLHHRLADMQLEDNERALIEGTASAAALQQTIAGYQDILARQPGHADNDKILYQLAKAYDLQGNPGQYLAALDQLIAQYPDSALLTEAQFRRGELFFSQHRYAQAESAYTAALAGGERSAFYRNALYMGGWAQFKQDKDEPALDTFTTILDSLVPASGDLASLNRSDAELLNDCLRVTSLILAYRQDAGAIEAAFSSPSNRPYHPLLYRSLSDLHLEKRRYRDAADTYRVYIETYPHSSLSPDFSLRIIDIYERGGFPTLAVQAKQQFVEDFGVNSPYWAQSTADVKAELQPHLRDYLADLAQYEHATGQAQMRSAQSGNEESGRQALKRAGAWYAQYAATFQKDGKASKMIFLRGESLFEAGDFSGAIEAYEQVAYASPGTAEGAEAGYAAIVAYDALLEQLPDNTVDGDNWQARKIESSLQFAAVYPADPRAVPVLGQAARDALELERYRDAIAIASRITGQPVSISPQWEITAWLVQGHAAFELEDYVAAESAYRKALERMPKQTEERDETVERLAAALYQQAVQHAQSERADQAVDSYLRVAQVTPKSSISPQAQHDAAALLLTMGRWQEAEAVLLELRNRYPDSPLSSAVPTKLSEAYLQQGETALAAREYAVIAESGESPEIRRPALFLSAELYQQSGQHEEAIQGYLRYIDRYSEPVDAAAEAKYQLSELYGSTNRPEQRLMWLQNLIDSDATQRSNGTERTRYLAAKASAALADDIYQTFIDSELQPPLEQSLRKKQSAMERALSAYEALLDYEIAEFVSLANYRIGQMYVELSADLMQSSRPGHLNALEREQYDLMLEELAYPFEEQGITILETNARRVLSGLYDDWVQASFRTLATLMPARYAKTERTAGYADELQ